MVTLLNTSHLVTFLNTLKILQKNPQALVDLLLHNYYKKYHLHSLLWNNAIHVAWCNIKYGMLNKLKGITEEITASLLS